MKKTVEQILREMPVEVLDFFVMENFFGCCLERLGTIIPGVPPHQVAEALNVLLGTVDHPIPADFPIQDRVVMDMGFGNIFVASNPSFMAKVPAEGHTNLTGFIHNKGTLVPIGMTSNLPDMVQRVNTYAAYHGLPPKIRGGLEEWKARRSRWTDRKNMGGVLAYFLHDPLTRPGIIMAWRSLHEEFPTTVNDKFPSPFAPFTFMNIALGLFLYGKTVEPMAKCSVQEKRLSMARSGLLIRGGEYSWKTNVSSSGLIL